MVNGFGGVFFKSKNPKALTAWYDTHLGTAFGSNTYHTFKWRERENPTKIGSTAFSIFTAKSTYFAPSKKPFMFNFRVQNLDAFLDKLIADGVKVDTKRDYTEYGNFGWIYDLEENKIEIWEAVDEVLEAYDSK
ncbi:MAG: VOC family protein [Bacteroidetes bacterium]|nr:VOC family protein [Bacteroidota bacterium]